jgi:hypothetical protein
MLFECQNGFRKVRYCIDPIFCEKLSIKEKREFESEAHFAFLGYENYSPGLNDMLFGTVEGKCVPNLLVKDVLEIYTYNTIEIRVNDNNTDK